MAAGELPAELHAGPDTDAEELAQLVGCCVQSRLIWMLMLCRSRCGGEAPEDSKGAGWRGHGPDSRLHRRSFDPWQG